MQNFRSFGPLGAELQTPLHELQTPGHPKNWTLLSPFITSKPLQGSESFRSMTPPKVRFLMPKKVLGAQKSFLVPHKKQKIDFFQKPEFRDLTVHWGWFPL